MNLLKSLNRYLIIILLGFLVIAAAYLLLFLLLIFVMPFFVSWPGISGKPIDYLVIFLTGAGLSFTPCVYPLIPIITGYIGIGIGVSKLKGFSLSLIYVTGMAITYSILGLLASLTGILFGSIASSPVTNFILGIIFIVFGISMLDLFTIHVPNVIKTPVFRKQNFLSTFLLGLSSGLVVSPCLSPALGSILAYLATKKNLLYGTTLLFTFAYGMGFIFILAGTFSGVLVNLPKSGKWMEHVKKVCAFILIGMGAYFIFVGLRRL